MTKPAMLLAWGAIGLLAANHAQAATKTTVAYRCEVPPGAGEPARHRAEVRYQLHACDGGRPMLDRDPRTDAQRRDTTRAAQTDAQLARQLQRERRHLEGQTQGQGPAAMDLPQHRRQRLEEKDKTKVYLLKRKRHFTAKTTAPDTPKAKANKAKAE